MTGPKHSPEGERPLHPPGGRCMPLRCYCGTCPSYVPLNKIDISADLLKATTASNAKHAASWADRKEPTWMEKS